MREVFLDDIDKIKDIKALIEIASKSFDNDILLKLSNNPCINVRRAVSRNIHTPSFVIDILSADVTENVRYMALKHRKCNSEKVLLSNHKCVVCEVEEIETLERCLLCG